MVSMYESIASMQASLTWDPVMWGCRFEVVDARTCYGKTLEQALKMQKVCQSLKMQKV